MNFTDYLVVNERDFSEKTAIRSANGRWTYEELVTDVRRFSNVLQKDGISSEDNVAVMLPNTYEFVVSLFGMLAQKNLTGLIDPRIKQGELECLIEKMNPAAIVTTEDNVASIRAIDDEITVYCTSGEPDASCDFWDNIETASDEYRIPETLGDRAALMIHTSGSTGQPKAVVHPHSNFIAVSDLATISYELDSATTYLSALPLFHCWGLMNLGATLKAGGEVVLLERWNPEKALERIEKHEVDFFAGVPTMFKDLLSVIESDTPTVSSLELAITGGAGVPKELIPRAESLLDCPVLNGWGMTETFAAGVWEEQSQERQIPSIGKMDDRLFEIKIVDQENGREVPRGEAGELLIRGEAMMEGYLGQPAESEEVFTDGWFHTGDIARIDQNGFVYLQDRAKYMIITGGENIYPQAVEDVIEELDGVQNAIVVAKPDERKGEKPVAFVEREDEAEVTEDEIKAHCLDHLAAYKHPRSVTFIENPPRNSIGKIQRKELEDRVSE